MKKLKLSWSILSAWSSGRRDDAITMLMGDSIEGNVLMKEGKRIHEIIANKKLKLLPFIKDTAVFEGDRENRINYFKVDVFDWLEMSMVADVLDPIEGLLIDWKTGNRKSTQHNKLQLYVYAYLLSKLPEPIEIKKAVIAKVGEIDDAILVEDFSLYKINKEKLELAENYIESNACEIYDFLSQQN